MVKKSMAECLKEQGVPQYGFGGKVMKLGKKALSVGTLGISDKLLGQDLLKKSKFTPSISNAEFQSDLAIQRQRANEIYAQQKTLAEALGAQARGEGPNPALAQLQMATGQNVGNQMAMAAGARGANLNPALAARQAMLAGGNIQQQAAGQGAVMQAQQQLAAQNAYAGQLQGMQGMAFNQAGQNLSAILGQDQARMGIENANAAARNALVGGVLNSVAGAATMGLAGGGTKPGAKKDLLGGGPTPGEGPTSNIGAHGGQLQSRGGFVTPYKDGGQVPFPLALVSGGKVPGKAQKEGDSLQNDIQPALLSPGEIVIPRSIALHKDAPEKAKSFVEQIRNVQNSKTYKKVLNSKVDVAKMSDGGMTGFEDPLQAAFPAESADIAAIGNTPPPLAPPDLQAYAPAPMPQVAAPGSAEISNKNAEQPTQKQKASYDLYGGADDDFSKAMMSVGRQEAAREKESAALQNKFAVDLQEKEKDFTAKTDAIRAQIDSLVGDIKDGKINPNQMWQQMGAGQKVGTIAAMILGGIASGMTGRANVAMAAYDKMVEQDIDAQKANLGKKQSLLQLNMQRFGDESTAMAATRLQMHAALEAKVLGVAEKTGSDLAISKAKALIAQEKSKNVDDRLKVAKFLQEQEAREQAMKTNDPSALLTTLPESERKNGYNEIQKLKEHESLIDNVERIYAEAKDVNRYTSSLGEKKTKLENLNAQLLSIIRSASKEDAGLKAEEIKDKFGGMFIGDSALGINFGTMFQGKEEMDEKLQGMKDFIHQAHQVPTTTLDAYNIPYKKPNIKPKEKNTAQMDLDELRAEEAKLSKIGKRGSK